MLQLHWRSRLNESRFHGTLIAGDHAWEVYFLDVSRVERDWIIECVVVGPRVNTVTIRCRSESSHGDAARRIMGTLRDWLVSGEGPETAYLEVAELDRAS